MNREKRNKSNTGQQFLVFRVLENGKAYLYSEVSSNTRNTRYTATVHYLVTENEEECFRLNSSPHAGGEQQGVEGEDGNANQQADYKRSRYKQQQRRRPRPQVGGGAASVADLLALCSASLDGQRNECMKFDDDSFLIFTENVVFIVSLRVSCAFMGLLLSFFSPYAWSASRTKLSLYGQCLLPISVVNRVVIILLRVEQQSLMRIKKENPTIQYPMIILLIGLDVTSNDQRLFVEWF
ncbi:hypothetical protein T08_4322 [Trichinella sp. T8]|nr:hypothetical protein T08_4322 [Trichinella sp. T8]